MRIAIKNRNLNYSFENPKSFSAMSDASIHSADNWSSFFDLKTFGLRKWSEILRLTWPDRTLRWHCAACLPETWWISVGTSSSKRKSVASLPLWKVAHRMSLNSNRLGRMAIKILYWGLGSRLTPDQPQKGSSSPFPIIQFASGEGPLLSGYSPRLFNSNSFDRRCLRY